jgi:cytidine deaminase
MILPPANSAGPGIVSKAGQHRQPNHGAIMSGLPADACLRSPRNLEWWNSSPEFRHVMKSDDAIVQEMREAAQAAMKNAYCRYSKFRVGAAVLTAEGEIFAGCNVENASYGLTMCAERNAIFQAVAQGGRKVTAIVIVTGTKSASPPCGACRQVINEFGPNAEVFLFGKGKAGTKFKMSRLLPDAFGPRNLGGGK